MKRVWSVGALSLALISCAKNRPPETAKAADGLIHMEEAAQRRAGVKVEPARVAELKDYLSVTGTVQPADGRVAEVRTPAHGHVLSVAVQVGARVVGGQELARMENLEAAETGAQLAAARAELKRIEVLLAAQRRVAERARDLVEAGAAPRKEQEQSRAEAEALEASANAQRSVVASLVARLRRLEPGEGGSVTVLRAPFAGIVTKANAAPGEVVDGSRALFTVADLSRVWVQANVYEQDLGRVTVGQQARIHVDAYPGEVFTGQVRYISDTLDAQTRTAPVRCEVANAGARLKLDMYVTVELPTTFERRALAVPETAVQKVDGRDVVFVRRGAAGFEMRQLRAGKTLHGQVEVLGGLREGEPVVTSGAFHLKSIIESGSLGEE